MTYEEARAKGRVVRDDGGYDLSVGEMNPIIFKGFVELMISKGVRPVVVWEPFAGHTGRSRTQDLADETGIEVVSFDLSPCDERVARADSTSMGPRKAVGGILFHPPYYGSAALSKERGEVPTGGSENDYKRALRIAAKMGNLYLEPGGLVCAVGRDYRHEGKRIRLDRWYLEIFEGLGMTLVDVWKSEPDVVLVFERRMS